MASPETMPAAMKTHGGHSTWITSKILNVLIGYPVVGITVRQAVARRHRTVVTGSAAEPVNRVVECLELVVAGISPDAIDFGPSDQRIVASAAEQRIAPLTAVDGVSSTGTGPCGIAVDTVAAVPAEKRVETGAPGQRIMPAPPLSITPPLPETPEVSESFPPPALTS